MTQLIINQTTLPAIQTLTGAPIPTKTTPWYYREGDLQLSMVQALDLTRTLAQLSLARDLPLSAFQVIFQDEQVLLQEVATGETWPLGHWAFNQFCSLVGAPPSFIRTLSGPLAVACLKEKLSTRNKSVSVYRLKEAFEGRVVNTIRAMTSARYARFEDHKALEWVQATGFQTSRVDVNDRGISVSLLGPVVKGPDLGNVALTMMVGNSEVGSASVTAQAVLQRDGWRIPITLAGVRIRHIGDIANKSREALDKSLVAFKAANTGDLEAKLQEAAQEETMTLGQWYSFLKARKVGKKDAKEILGVSAEMDPTDHVSTSRWKLAVLLATKAAQVPYFDERVQHELIASKVLGV